MYSCGSVYLANLSCKIPIFILYKKSGCLHISRIFGQSYTIFFCFFTFSLKLSLLLRKIHLYPTPPMPRISISDLSELPRAAELFLQALGERKVVAFYAEMGTGKTTFTAALARALGVEDAVNSPTFAILNEYRDTTGAPIYHFDFYRLRSAAGIQSNASMREPSSSVVMRTRTQSSGKISSTISGHSIRQSRPL